MKRHILFLALFFVFFACGGKKEPFKVVEKTYKDGTPMVVRYYASPDKKVLLSETSYYRSGAKKMSGAFKDGKRDGRWKAWFPNGKLWSEGEYVRGEETGIKTVYYENGNKYYSGRLQAGKRVGEWSFWSPEGKLLKKVTY